jgi:predicted enzyme related to lactoylglutathione lyase
MANTIDWVEIRTGDIERAEHFYMELFGWETIAREATEGQEYWIFDTGEEPRVENLRRVGMWARPTGEKLGAVVYIVVDDIDAVLKKVSSLGGDIISQKVAQGSSYRAVFADLDGNYLGLWQEVDIS